MSQIQEKGMVHWFARHAVAANLLMLVCLLGGLLFMGRIGQEVFPDFALDKISITVVYPGASPAEIESGVLLAIEDKISSLTGIDDVTSTAKEGKGVIVVEVVEGANVSQISEDIQRAVNQITSLPVDAEVPQVAIVETKRKVISLALYGDTSEKTLHELAEQFRDELVQDPQITFVELEGVRPLEISINVPQENLRRYKLSLGEIAQRVKEASLDLPSGSVKTENGEILIRMKERKERGREFAKIPIINTANGSHVLLGDIAQIDDSYQDTNYSASYNGNPAVMVQVYRVGKESPITVSDAVKAYIEKAQPELPKGIIADIRYDASDDYRQRIDLLLKNSAQGLILVVIVLGIFLELRLAMWIAMGIPVSFLGAFLILPSLGVTLNMVSLFAFMITLGIVVDDAIVIGEHVYHYRQQGHSAFDSAVRGVQEMAIPVTFSILTNIVTFMPLLFIPGEIGKIFYVIPVVVITVFSFSLLESILVLPNHLSKLETNYQPRGVFAWIFKHQQRFSDAFVHWVRHSFRRFIDNTLKYRYLTVLSSVLLLVLVFSYVLSGRMGMTLFPKTEADFANAVVTLPFGTPVEKTQKVVAQLNAAAQRVIDKTKDGDLLLKGKFAEIAKKGSNTAEVRIYLAPPDVREKIMSTDEFANLWREETGELVGVESLIFESDSGSAGAGAALTIQLNHRDLNVLQAASHELAETLRGYTIVKDIDEGFSGGKQQLDFTILPEGKSLGLSAQNVARQVRNAFYGAEVLREQRGRNEIKVMVRLPQSERLFEQDIENFLLWTPSGKEIPLRDVVKVERTRADTEINRRNGRRNIQVKADVLPRSKAGDIKNDLKLTELPRLQEKYAGLEVSFEGRQADMAESLGSLKTNFLFALLGVYLLLAIPFKSYSLPLIVMVSIPFSVIGAVIGHQLLGYDLSVLSLFGIVALAGVVVNDSLILIDHAIYLKTLSPQRNAREIILISASQRFRQIILTTLTTFFGLAPLILETSRQAKILIPMAISIAFGSVFATMITLILIPSLYVIVDDFRQKWRA